ncbi:DUF6779 domain-containing protein [Modestobacter italicus]|uniref:DUF6779 domain-containing protein n=1 Tax=Modestobacter italicus (strain DSM 44449 / CECT 9708 / BC 501) TaxID=2732864 RepID=UPI001412F1D7|nr:DUF6779 domain-containing protein [Modestobacter marinus]
MPPAPTAAGASASTPPPAPPVPEQRRNSNRGWLLAGLLLAAGGSAAVLLTDDARYLRVALLAVCWAFVVAAFVAGSRRADQVAAAGREAELRHAYDLELEREVTARQQFQVELEGRLRREAEGAVRGELAQLRAELSGLSALRDDLAGLGRLRTEVAALAELRGELSGLGELRGELGRIRAELTEQLSGELLVERMVMRAQSVRGPAQPGTDGRVLEGGTAWDPAPMTSGWDVDRWSETRVVPAEPVEPVARPAAGERPAREWPVPAEDGPPTTALPAAAAPTREPAPEPAPDAWSGYDASRYDALLFGTSAPSHQPPSPETPSYGTPSYGTPSFETPSHETRSFETPSHETHSYEPPSHEAPSYEWSGAAGSTARGSRHDASGYAEDGTAPAADEPVRAAPPEPPGHARLEQILAESGVPAPTGARARRRHHRDDDGGGSTDDVLARVLGR